MLASNEHGQMDGRQIVPAAWVAESLVGRTQSPISGHRYGYGWWSDEMEGHAVIGTAVWRPPHAAVTGIRAQLRGLLTRWRLLALSPRVGTMLLQGFANLEAIHPEAPHWYLFFIGIDSRWRGQGIGAQLMAPVLQAADVGKMPCYLETPFPQTLPFYRKLGYEVTSEPRPFTGAPQLWAMMRKTRRER